MPAHDQKVQQSQKRILVRDRKKEPTKHQQEAEGD